MSNRRRIRPVPPRSVVRFASAYRCSDCPSTIGRLRLDRHGVWHIEVKHEPGCPQLSGAVDTAPDTVAAARRVAATGERVAYFGGFR